MLSAYLRGGEGRGGARLRGRTAGGGRRRSWRERGTRPQGSRHGCRQARNAQRIDRFHAVLISGRGASGGAREGGRALQEARRGEGKGAGAAGEGSAAGRRRRGLGAHLKVAGMRRPLSALSSMTPQTAGVKPSKAARSPPASPPREREGSAAAPAPASSSRLAPRMRATPIQIMIQTVTCTLLTYWFSPSVLRT